MSAPMPTKADQAAHTARVRALMNELDALPVSEHETARVCFLCWYELAALCGRNNEGEVLRAWQEREVAGQGEEDVGRE